MKLLSPLLFIFLTVGCSSINDNDSSVMDLSSATKIERSALSDDTWNVTCKDGRTETRTTDQVRAENFCNPVKTCQTTADINSHVDIEGPKLVLDGKAVSDLNERFCIHTVQDGTKRLADGAMLGSSSTDDWNWVKDGLQIAVADIHSNGSGAMNFYEAQIACASLTLLNLNWSAPQSADAHWFPWVNDRTISIDSLGKYLFNPGPKRLQDAFWSGSQARSNIYANYEYQKKALQYITNSDSGNLFWDKSLLSTSGVRCIATQ